jgi:hypothetical protein
MRPWNEPRVEASVQTYSESWMDGRPFWVLAFVV